jgi:hypothetical protein
MDPRVAAFVAYYAREGQAHHLQAVCSEMLRRAPSPALALWRAYGLLLGGATAEVRARACRMAAHAVQRGNLAQPRDLRWGASTIKDLGWGSLCPSLPASPLPCSPCRLLRPTPPRAAARQALRELGPLLNDPAVGPAATAAALQAHQAAAHQDHGAIAELQAQLEVGAGGMGPSVVVVEQSSYSCHA